MTNVFAFLSQASGDPNLLLTTVLLPFLLIFVILWGILNVMKIFGAESTGRKINLIIALVVTIFAAFTDAWGIVATQLAAATGVFVYVMFFAVFIIGTILWAIGRTRGIYHRAGTGTQHFKDIKNIDKQLEKLYKKAREAEEKGNEEMVQSLSRDIGRLEQQKEALYRRGIGHH